MVQQVLSRAIPNSKPPASLSVRFTMLVAHLIVMAVFLVQLITLFLIGKAGLRVFVGKVVGVDLVERGGQGFSKFSLAPSISACTVLSSISWFAS